MPTGPKGEYVPHWLGPLETYFQPGYYVSGFYGDHNRLRAEGLQKELWGLSVVLKTEFSNVQPPLNSLSEFLGYLRKKYAEIHRLPDTASFEDIRKKIERKKKVKK